MITAVFNKRAEIYVALFLSVMTGVVWFFLSNYDRLLTVYHDEVTYIESARDIYNGISPLLQHLRPSYFSKVFYSYLIAPGFAFNDPTVWQTLLNAVFSAFTVLFTWLCSRLLIESSKLRVVCVFLSALLPIYSYTVYATPDCLFFCETALSFLIFTALCRSILDGVRKRTVLLLAVLLGLVNFLSYFTKEVASAFIISECAALILTAMMDKERRGVFLQAFAAGVIAFLLFSLYLKFILIPEDAGNSYQSQIIPLTEFMKKADWSRLSYKFFYMATGACFSVYLVPLLAPLFEFRRLQPLGRILCFTVLCSFVILTLAVIYTISWAEDYSREYPIWHFRYHGAYLPLLLVLTVLAFEKRSFAHWKKRLYIGAMIFFCAAMALFYPMPDEELTSIYDNATINLFNHSMYFYGSGLELDVRQKISLVLLLVSVSALFVPFLASGTGQNPRAICITGLIASSALFLGTGYFYAGMNKLENGISPDVKGDAMELASFLDRLKPQAIVLLVEKERALYTSVFYTYVRRPAMSVPANVFYRDSAKRGTFDFTLPHHIGMVEHSYNSRYLYPEVVMPAPDVIVETGDAFVEFPGKEVIFLSRNRHYAVVLNRRAANLPVKQENHVKEEPK